MSRLIGEKFKPINNSAVQDHLLYYNHLPSLDKFRIMKTKIKKILQIKKNLVIMKDKPFLNRELVQIINYLTFNIKQ